MMVKVVARDVRPSCLTRRNIEWMNEWMHQQYQHIARSVRSGVANINDFGANYLIQSLPFGGVKGSGFGRFAGKEGLRACCFTKVCVVSTSLFVGVVVVACRRCLSSSLSSLLVVVVVVVVVIVVVVVVVPNAVLIYVG